MTSFKHCACSDSCPSQHTRTLLFVTGHWGSREEEEEEEEGEGEEEEEEVEEEEEDEEERLIFYEQSQLT